MKVLRADEPGQRRRHRVERLQKLLVPGRPAVEGKLQDADDLSHLKKRQKDLGLDIRVDLEVLGILVDPFHPGRQPRPDDASDDGPVERRGQRERPAAVSRTRQVDRNIAVDPRCEHAERPCRLADRLGNPAEFFLELSGAGYRHGHIQRARPNILAPAKRVVRADEFVIHGHGLFGEGRNLFLLSGNGAQRGFEPAQERCQLRQAGLPLLIDDGLMQEIQRKRGLREIPTGRELLGDPFGCLPKSRERLQDAARRRNDHEQHQQQRNQSAAHVKDRHVARHRRNFPLGKEKAERQAGNVAVAASARMEKQPQPLAAERDIRMSGAAVHHLFRGAEERRVRKAAVRHARRKKQLGVGRREDDAVAADQHSEAGPENPPGLHKRLEVLQIHVNAGHAEQRAVLRPDGRRHGKNVDLGDHVDIGIGDDRPPLVGGPAVPGSLPAVVPLRLAPARAVRKRTVRLESHEDILNPCIPVPFEKRRDERLDMIVRPGGAMSLPHVKGRRGGRRLREHPELFEVLDDYFGAVARRGLPRLFQTAAEEIVRPEIRQYGHSDDGDAYSHGKNPELRSNGHPTTPPA